MNQYMNHLNKRVYPKLLVEIKNDAIKRNVPIITDEGLEFLLMIIKIKKPKRILEIGTAVAYSAINMALECSEVFVDTIERDPLMYQEALENIKKCEINNITVFFADALEIDLSALNDSYDILFIDAAKAQYIKFFEKFEVLLNQGAIVISDNLLFHGLVENNENIESKNLRHLVEKIDKYNKWLAENEKYETSFFAIGDGMAVSVKKNV